jgi:hypothetical protein
MMSLPNNDARFQRLAQLEGNHLQLTCQLIIHKPRFEPQEYKALREFYDRTVSTHAEQIALKRIAAPVITKVSPN